MASPAVEDAIANKVLQECSQDIVDNIDVDLVILRLHSKGRLTAKNINRLENISTSQEKKRQLYMLALADKGSAAFEDIVDVLNDTAKHQPHVDLADKLSKHYQRLLSQHSNKHGEPQEVKATVIKKKIETATDHLEKPYSDNSNDIDRFSEHSGDQSPLLPDSIAEDVVQPNYQSYVKQASNVDMMAGSSDDVEASTNIACGYQSSMESSRRIPNLSSSLQDTSDNMMCQTPSSVEAPGYQPAGVTSRMNQSERAYSVISNVTRESGFASSFARSKPTVLIKSPTELHNMKPIKLIVLGDGGVGKTYLVQQFLHGTYYDPPKTVGKKLDEYYFKHVQKEINIKLSVWDTAGDHNALSPMFYRDAHAAIVVFDVTNLKSLFNVKDWKTQIVRQTSNKDNINVPVLLVGNKCDIAEGSDETRIRAQGIAEDFDDFIEASAKENYNVENVFEKAISLALKHYTPHGDAAISLNQQQQQQQQSTCC